MAKKITTAGIFTALAIGLAFIERLIPVNFGIPGIKLGLANIVTVTSLFIMGPIYAIVIQITRVVLSTFLFGSPAGLIYSLSGGLLSVAVMVLIVKIPRPVFSIVAISVAGAVFHNIGQILAASFVVMNLNLAFYLPVLMISGVVTGIFVGFVSKYLVSALDRSKVIQVTDINIRKRM
jgi:heptaprenyl diphosphate synthase